MADGRAERAGGGALTVDVDPLVVAGRLRERIDALLGDLDPGGGTVLGAYLEHSPHRTTLAAHV